MATADCTDRELKDIYPHIDDFDNKVPIYGWEETGTSDLYLARNSGLVTQLFADGEDLGDAEANSGVVDVNGEWYYDSTLDTVYYFNSAKSPADMLMEAGEDWVTLKTRFRENASRYFESKIDKTLPREQFKDKDGNYDYLVVRTTALLAASFLIKSHEPTSDIAQALLDEANNEIDKLNSGDNTLSWMTTGDSSKGIVREITGTGAIRIVDTRGRYGGTYDKIGVKITTGGRFGAAKYSVWIKDSDYLGAERMNNSVTANLVDEVINGQFQSLTGGLQIRFGGDTADVAIADDKWEIEVSGYYEEVDNASSMRSVRMTRK